MQRWTMRNGKSGDLGKMKIDQNEVADQFIGWMGIYGKMTPIKVFDYVIRGFMLYDPSFGSFDLPFSQRTPDKVIAALRDMRLRTGIKNLRDTDDLARVGPACLKIEKVSTPSEMAEIVHGFSGQWGTVTAWKVFAFLKPERVPVLDRIVVKVYSKFGGKKEPNKKDFSFTAEALMVDFHGGWCDIASEIHSNLDSKYQERLTPLRIFDIILWTYGKGMDSSGRGIVT